MRIQHNIMAMNAYRNYNNNTSALSKNLEKLSSGYKINRAGDDAAGLAISEKMRAQITGLDVAQKNAKDGISLVQTAEGALTEVHDMLNRMVELAEQSANGTYEDNTDRDQLQKEFDKLTEEIDRIADASNFNGIKLLNGDMGGPKVTATSGNTGDNPATAAVYTFDFSGMSALTDSQTLQIAGKTLTATTTGDGSNSNEIKAGDPLEDQLDDVVGALNSETLTNKLDGYTASRDGNKIILTKDTTGSDSASQDTIGKATWASQPEATATFADGIAANTPIAAKTEIDFTGKTGADMIGGTMTVGNTIYEFVENAGDVTGTNTAIVVGKEDEATALATKVQAAIDGDDGNSEAAIGGVDYRVTAAGNVLKLEEKTAAGTTEAPEVKFAGMGITLQIGDTGDDYNRITVEISSIKKDALMDLTEGTGKVLSDLKVSTASDAVDAMKSLKGMINYISDIRGTLGATQNRLDHTINNLSVMEENIQDAESTIRDTDVADEMMAYTKNNILIQSAQAMLAQANQVPQGVLQLLQ